MGYIYNIPYIYIIIIVGVYIYIIYISILVAGIIYLDGP